MNGDTEREVLTAALDGTFRLYESCTKRDCPHHEPDELQDLADAILAEFLPEHDKRVRAEQRETDIAAVKLFCDKVSGLGFTRPSTRFGKLLMTDRFRMFYCDNPGCLVNTFERGDEGLCPGCYSEGIPVDD